MKNKHCKCGATNPEEFYSYHNHTCKKCHIQKQIKKYHSLSPEEKQIKKAKKNEWIKNNYLFYRVNNTRSRAKANNIPFNIAVSDVQEIWEKQGGKCYYTDQPMILGPSPRRWQCVSIDRVDSDRGYEKDNIVLCRGIVNLVKNELSVNELLEIIDQIKTTMSSKNAMSKN
jgi:hypothetical protein